MMRRHMLAVALFLVALLVVRQLYPYVSGNEPDVVEGYEVSLVASGLGGPTCLVWANETHLLVCDRDRGAIVELNIETDERRTLLNGLDRPHGLALADGQAFVSEAGKLTAHLVANDGLLIEGRVLVEGIKAQNHQTNTVDIMPNGTLLWHSGSTCNVCIEEDSRNAALLWVDPITGDHGVLASGVRNSFDGVWVEGHGYFFTDNGRDWDGDYPREELNFMIPGEDYGWPHDEPGTPVPAGTQAPVGTWTPHTSVNGIDLRPVHSSLPGLSPSEGFTLYATVYGSWNTLLPQGHEILRIDVYPGETEATYATEITRFAWDAGTPLPLVFHPDGTLFYATFGNGGSLYTIDASPTSS